MFPLGHRANINPESNTKVKGEVREHREKKIKMKLFSVERKSV